jgi:hypothetical protein
MSLVHRDDLLQSFVDKGTGGIVRHGPSEPSAKSECEDSRGSFSLEADTDIKLRCRLKSRNKKIAN